MGDGIAQGAIDATGIAAGPEGYAFAPLLAHRFAAPSAGDIRVAAVPVTPPPAGLRRRPRHESARGLLAAGFAVASRPALRIAGAILRRIFGRHENVQASRRFTKRQGRFLDRSGTIRAKSISRMIFLAQFSCEPPFQSQFAHSRSMALIQFWLIFLSQGDCPILRAAI